MNDEQSPLSTGSQKIMAINSAIFFRRAKDKEELVEVIQDAEERDLIDLGTKSMLGVLSVAEMKVRDIMLPRSQMVTIERSAGVKDISIVIESAHSSFSIINEDKDHIKDAGKRPSALRF